MTTPLRKPRFKFRIAVIHCSRVLVLVLILLLMHWRYVRAVSEQRAAGLDAVDLRQIQALFPQATALGRPVLNGGRAVLSGTQTLGSVLQTFPEAEPFLGFSGPTNLLVGFNPQDEIVGLTILSSRDTRDHVELIRRSSRFLNSMNGMTARQAAKADVDAVTGATLTSLAILQGIQTRLGRQPGSLKFPETYTLQDARRLFPEAAVLVRDEQTPELCHVSGPDGNLLGTLISNSPAADEIVGYQGPTQAFLGMRTDGKIFGLILGSSYDNDPYVGYVRGDEWFSKTFNKKPLDDWAKMKWEETGIEGVSGATMTSQAVAEGLLLAARKIAETRAQQQQKRQHAEVTRWREFGTISLIAIGVLMGFTQLRRSVWFRRSYQVLLILVMGFLNGDLLSTAMFIGWAQSGIPWQNALGLLCLAAAAILVPVAFRQNVYCDHLCPHGALQQLLPRKLKLQRRPAWLIRFLSVIRPGLLVIVVLVPMLNWHFSLVDLEPFDAYSWRAAGMATICVAVAGLALSLFLPMGYCQYGCPTGAILGYLRRHSRSDQLGRSDGFAVLLLGLAEVCFLLS